MTSEKSRKAELLKKPLLPSRIPKKGERLPSRNKQAGARDLKRRYSSVAPKTESLLKNQLLGKEPLDKKPVTTEATEAPVGSHSLSAPAQELVKLIPTLTGVDVSNLVASIKRRRIQQDNEVMSGVATHQQRLKTPTRRELRPLFSTDSKPLPKQTEEGQTWRQLPELETSHASSTG